MLLTTVTEIQCQKFSRSCTLSLQSLLQSLDKKSLTDRRSVKSKRCFVHYCGFITKLHLQQLKTNKSLHNVIPLFAYCGISVLFLLNGKPNMFLSDRSFEEEKKIRFLTSRIEIKHLQAININYLKRNKQ